MAMQCFAKIGEIISLANGFLRSSSGAGINGWFERLNGRLGVGSAHRVTLNSHDIERAVDSYRQVGERRFLAARRFNHHPLVKRDRAVGASHVIIAVERELCRAVLAVMGAQHRNFHSPRRKRY
jgi:hypothetical protein